MSHGRRRTLRVGSAAGKLILRMKSASEGVRGAKATAGLWICAHSGNVEKESAMMGRICNEGIRRSVKGTPFRSSRCCNAGLARCCGWWFAWPMDSAQVQEEGVSISEY